MNSIDSGQPSQTNKGDKIYDDYLNMERKKEIEDFLKQLRKDMENKFIILDKDIAYLSEYQKYLSSVPATNAGRRES
jgi:hypothetical protein